MPVNVTQGGARQEQRMRYMCRAHLSDPHELQIGRKKVETRFCPNDGTVACETDSKLTIVVSRVLLSHFTVLSPWVQRKT